MTLDFKPQHEWVVYAVQESLDDDLRRAPWKGSDDELEGHCYVASEALHHLIPDVSPQFIWHEGVPHWFLRDADGDVLDATASQFKTPVPYTEAKGKGFLTKNPSKRAKVVIERARKIIG